DVRSEETSLFRLGFFSNGAMNKAFLAGLALQLAVLLLSPLQGAFGVVPLDLTCWLTLLALAVTPVVVCEGEKAVRRRKRKVEEKEKVVV
ncbi:MAG: cation transporting ATPase C-terminal domain-containing protein, partial [Ruminiclostridium sp.]|nr:cation transporting ATPase C-terminal domain-containing protein [Ruminiclostridium sp.]